MYKVYCDDVLIHDGSSPDNSVHILSPNLDIGDSVAGSFSFVLPTTNVAYNTIELFASTIVIEKNGEKIWIGRPISASLDFYNQISYNCEGALAFLNDSIQEPDVSFTHYDPAIFISRCLALHNEKVDATRRIYPGTINVTDPDDAYIYESDYVTTWSAIKTNCLDRLIGHMRIRYRKYDLRMYLDYINEYFDNDASQEINFGNNLLTFTRDFNITDVVTVVIPLGKQLEPEEPEEEEEPEGSEEDTYDDNVSYEVDEYEEYDETEETYTVEDIKKEYLTVESVNNGSIYVINAETLSRYGRVEQVVNFSDVEDPNDLLRLANLYLSEMQFSEMNLEIHAIDMNYLTKTEKSFELLDLVHCISAPHGLDGWFPITKISIPIDQPENTVYYLGYRTGGQSTMSGKSSDSRSDISREIAAAEKSAVVKTEVLLADYAHITDGIIDNARIGYAEIDGLEANYAHIVDGVIDNAKIDQANVNNLQANYAHISAGLIDNAYVGYERVQDLSAHYAHIQNGIIDNAKIDQADVNNLRANYAHITDGVIDNAQIGHADVVDLDTTYAHITDGVIDNAKIGYANVNELDTHYAKVDISNVSNSWITRGVIKDASISDAMISGVSANKLTAGEIDAGVIRVYNLNASNINVGTINGQLVGKGTLSLDTLNEDVYTAEEIENIVSGLNDRIDGAIDTFTGTVVPTLVNYPANEWDTNAKKDQHVGDVYYITDSSSEYDGYSYRFSKLNNTYSWVLIRDSAVTSALQRLDNVESDIGNIKQFDSDTTRWIDDTKESLRDIIQNHTELVTTTNRLLVSSTRVWINTDSDTTPPQKPDQPILSSMYFYDNNLNYLLDSDGELIPGQGWYIIIPEYDPDKPYYYYCYEYQYLDGTYGWSEPVYDRGISETYRLSNGGVESTIQLWTVRPDTKLPQKPTDIYHTGAGTYHEFLNDNVNAGYLDSNGNIIASGYMWSAIPPLYNPNLPNYFYCYEYQYRDGTYGWSDPVFDNATTESQSKTNLVMTELETRVTSNIFNELVHDVNENSATITTLSETTETALDQSVEYIIGTQNSATGAWTGISRDVQLKIGKSIAYKLPFAGSGNATLSLTLQDGTTTEAIPVYINDSRVDTQFEANSVINLTYDGNNWRATGYWTEDTYNRTRYESNITAATAIGSGRIICGTDSGYKNIGANVAFNLSHPLLYARDNIAKNSTGNNNDLMASNINYSTNGTIQNGSKDKVIYLKGSVSGNTFTIASSNYLTTKVPTVEDGYYYIPLGVMSSATNGSFSSTSQMMAYNGESFQQATVMSVTTSSTVNEVKQTATSNSAKIKNLTTRLGTNADGTGTQTDIISKYSDLEQDLGEFKTTVGETYYTITDAGKISTRLKQAETSITQNANKIKLKADSSNVYTKQETSNLISTEIENRNTALNVMAEGIYANVSATYITRTDFNTLYIDGRNLLKYTKAFSGIDLVDSSGVSFIDSNDDTVGKELDGSLVKSKATRLEEPNDSGFYIREFDYTNKDTSQYSDIIEYKNVFIPVLDKVYYFSFWAKGTGTILVYCPPANEGERFTTVNSQDDTRNHAQAASYITLSNEWTRYWIKIKLNDTSIPVNAYRLIRFRVYGGSEISLYGLKFEQNSKATDWSAAPEDYDIYMQNIGDLYERVERHEHKMDITETTFSSKIEESIVINRQYVDELISTEISKRSSEISQTSDTILARVSETYVGKGEFNSLQIGGRNYLRNTQKFTGDGYLDSNGQDITASGSHGPIVGSSDDRFVYRGVSTVQDLKYRDLAVRYYDATNLSSSTSLVFVEFNNVIVPKVGEFYCLGFNAKGTGSIALRFISDDGGTARFNVLTSQEYEANNTPNGSANINLTDDWDRHWVRWLCTEVTTEGNRNVRIVINGGNAAYICGMKFEVGSRPTDWTAAPEDGENYTSDYVRKIGDAIVESTEAYIKLNSDNIMSVVSAKTDKGEIISTINQSPEAISISADKINLIGNTTFKSLSDKVDGIDGDVADLSSSKADIQSTVADSQYIYRSAVAGANSRSPTTTWVTDDTGRQNAWTNVRPEYSSEYPVLFVAKQTKYVNGDVVCTTPKKDLTTTVIDGGHITTGIIDASHIAVNTISVGSLADGSSYTTKDQAVVESHTIYYRTSSGTVPNPTTWVTRSDDVNNKWTLLHPFAKKNYTVYVSHQFKYANNDVTWSDILIDSISQEFSEAVSMSQTIYYKTNSIISDELATPTSWVTRADDALKKWLCKSPPREDGKYIYVSQQTKFVTGTISCTAPVLETSYINYSFLDNTACDTQRVYKSYTDYQGSSISSSSAPELQAWITNSTGNQNVWTNVRPIYEKPYNFLYTAVQTKYASGAIATSKITRDNTTTVIDGGNIITNSITASQLDTTKIRVSNFADGGNYSLKSGTIKEIQYIYYKTSYSSTPSLPNGWVNETDSLLGAWTRYPLSLESKYYVYQAMQTLYANNDVTSAMMGLDRVASAIKNVTSVSAVQTIYANFSSGTLPSTVKAYYMPNGWVSNTSKTSYNGDWTVSRPQYSSSYPVTFIITQIKESDGKITNSDPSYDESTTVIDAGHITTGTIDASRIASGSISADKIASNTITSDKIAANAITSSKIDSEAITSSKIASNAITSSKISSEAITSDKIAANAITAGKITTNVLSGLRFGGVRVYRNGQEREAAHCTLGLTLAGSGYHFEGEWWNGWLVDYWDEWTSTYITDTFYFDNGIKLVVQNGVII